MSWVLLVTPLYVVLPSLYYTPCYIPQPVINPPAFKVFFLKRNCSNRRHRVVIFRTSGRDLTTWRPGLSSSFLYTRHLYTRILSSPFPSSIDYNSYMSFITDIYHPLFRTNCARVQFTLSVPFLRSREICNHGEEKRKRWRKPGTKLFECLPLNLSPTGRKRE